MTRLHGPSLLITSSEFGISIQFQIMKLSYLSHWQIHLYFHSLAALWHNPSTQRHQMHWDTQTPAGPWAKRYFHSTRLMQALRIGLLRVRQKRALGGLPLVDPPCFLLLAYCCLFFCASEPTGAGVEVVQTGGRELILGFSGSPCACRAALMAACQARTGLTPGAAPPGPWMELLGPRRPWAEPTGLPVLAGGWRDCDGWSWCRWVFLSDQGAEVSVGVVVLLLLAYCAPGEREWETGIIFWDWSYKQKHLNMCVIGGIAEKLQHSKILSTFLQFQAHICQLVIIQMIYSLWIPMQKVTYPKSTLTFRVFIYAHGAKQRL